MNDNLPDESGRFFLFMVTVVLYLKRMKPSCPKGNVP